MDSIRPELISLVRGLRWRLELERDLLGAEFAPSPPPRQAKPREEIPVPPAAAFSPPPVVQLPQTRFTPVLKNSRGNNPPAPQPANWEREFTPFDQRPAKLIKLREYIGDCRRCRLCEQRNSIVIDRGDPSSNIVFVGEGPGADEDAQGFPFVGRAGQLLDRIIISMGLDPAKVYICNVVKCRPPQNRTPLPDEQETCGKFLRWQLELIQPAMIVTLGAVATGYLLGTDSPMGKLRGKFHPYRGAKLMPTYHPAYLLRNPPAKKFVWEDMQKVMAEMGLKAPPRDIK
ncbi:MAG: hypothetical protein GMKNLPBB_00867 [Myxococcota bacterium]|nr:hypothetical protein [Myxococcota bacterium]